MSRKTQSLALGALLAVLCPLSVARADPLEIRIGWAQAGHLAPLLDVLPSKHPEVMPHFGKTYVSEAIRFNGSTPQIQAIAINELEIAAFATSSLALAITNADLDMRIVSDLLQDGRKGNFDEPYLVRKDGPIKTIEDLKGKRVATNAIGSASDTAMRIGLRKHGIADKDITTVEANFTNMLAMIEDGKVDMIAGLPQTLKDIEATGRYRTLYTAGEVRGPAQTVLWAMRAGFIKDHRPALVDFFEDHIRAVRWFLDPRNRDEALAITQQVTKQKRESLEFFFTKDDFYRSPDALPDLDAAQREIDESVKLGILPKAVTLVPAYVDLSMVQEALHRIDGR